MGLNFPDTPTIGQIFPSPGVAGVPVWRWDGVEWAPVPGLTTSIIMPRGHLSGLTLSTAGGSASFGVAAGQAVDGTNVDVLNFPSAVTKTTGPWAVGSGNGALDTGVIATVFTWYHVHLIKRPDTGIVDVLISLSATAPLLPAGYTLFRRIGSMIVDASSHWVAFTQNGDEFLWMLAFADASNITAIGPANYTLSVPPGVRVNAIVQVTYANSTAVATFLAYPPDIGTQSPNTPVANWLLSNPSTVAFGAGTFNIRTNLSSQIAAVCSIAAGNSFYLITRGWIDRRGRDA